MPADPNSHTDRGVRLRGTDGGRPAWRLPAAIGFGVTGVGLLVAAGAVWWVSRRRTTPAGDPPPPAIHRVL